MPKSIVFLLFAALLSTGCPQKEQTPAPTLNPGAATALGAGQRANIRTVLQNIKKSCTQFNAEKGTWPADMDELVDSGIWQDADRADPWGNDYVIEGEGSTVTVSTYGADGEPGGEDGNLDYTSDAGR